MSEQMPEPTREQMKLAVVNQVAAIGAESDRPHKEGLATDFLMEVVIAAGYEGAKAQRELLYKEGWGKVPSVGEIATKLDEVKEVCSDYIDPNDSIAKLLHRWLREGQ